MLLKTIFLLLIAFIINAQSAESIIQRIQTKFSTVEDLKADFIQKMNSPSADNTLTLSGKFYFKKEDKLRIEVQNRIIISDGITVWNIDESNNKVIISLYDVDYTTFSLPTIINAYPDLCDKELISDESGTTLIKLVPTEDQLSFKSAIISVDRNDNIEKVEITDFNGMQFLFELESIKTNSDLSDQLFNYEPAEGVEVIDLR